MDFRWLEDFVGVSQRQTPQTRFEGEAIFVGHGITAPEWKWDDFKGVDVKGKVLVLFTNEPASNDPKFFEGRALTYYGRWTYKYEEAVRRGARGRHHHPHHSHRGLRLGSGAQLLGPRGALREAGARARPSLAFQGWVTREAGEKLLALAGKTVDELLAASEKRDFRPIPLGIRIRGSMPAKVRELDTRNVAAIVPGSDPKLKDEVVVFSAHWDHLGIGTPVNGDAIYNGAIDNATGCAILMELARAWAALPQKPRRSALFLSVTAEEGGLRGSEYYAAHPLYPAAKTAIDLNYDAALSLGPRQGRGAHRRRAHHGLAAGAADRQTAEPGDFARRPAGAGPLLPFRPLLVRARRHSGVFHRARHRVRWASPRATARRRGKSTTASTTTSPRTNSRRIGISPRSSRRPSTASLLGLEIANQDKLPDWRAGRPVPPVGRGRRVCHPKSARSPALREPHHGVIRQRDRVAGLRQHALKIDGQAAGVGVAWRCPQWR